MFTGLVERMGRLVSRKPQGSGARLSIEHGYGPLALGESISVNGACLTVVVEGNGCFDVDVSPETLDKTTLGAWQVGQALNLERALAFGARLGGHLVTGHVDGQGEIETLAPEGEMTRVGLVVPEALARYVARKGSICVDGVSLTVNDVVDRSNQTRVDLFIIPHTLRETTLGLSHVGSRVNLEIDLIARYTERLLASASQVR
jgi:riboflavin synthase